MAMLAASVAVLSVVSIATLAWTTGWFHARQTEARLEDAARLLRSVAQYTRAQYAHLDAATRRVEALIAGRDPATLDPVELANIKRGAERPYLSSGLEVTVWLPSGVTAQTRDPAITVSDRDYFRVHTRPGDFADGGAAMRDASTGLAMGAPVQGRLRGIPIVPVSRALTDARGKLVGVVVASVPEAAFMELFGYMRREANDSVFFMRNDMMGMARDPFDALFSGKIMPGSLVFKHYPQEASGRFQGDAATDGIRRAGVFESLSPLPLVAGVSIDVAAQDWDSALLLAPVSLLNIATLCAALAFAAVAARALRASTVAARTADVERDHAVLSEARLAAMLTTANDGVVMLDAQMRIVVFNKSAEQIFGRSAVDIVGGTLDPLIPAAMREHNAELARGAMAAPDMSRQTGAWRSVEALHASGARFPALVSISKSTVAGVAAYLAIVRDMSDVAAAEAELKHAAGEQIRLRILAEQASRAKSLFLATMSHELRTPLNAIIGFSEMLSAGIGGPPGSGKYAEYLGYIQTSGRHLLSLINGILDLSKIQSAGNAMVPERIDCAEALDEALVMLEGKAAAKSVAFARAGLGNAVVLADRRALQQVLLNVLGNAVKFTAEATAVEIETAAAGEGRIAIHVRDRGPGISEEMLPQIGTPFTQQRELLTSNNEGTGLGLAITTALIKAMDGSASFANRPDGGLEVVLELPAG
jgi:PAS domain S-box-containing protein